MPPPLVGAVAARRLGGSPPAAAAPHNSKIPCRILAGDFLLHLMNDSEPEPAFPQKSRGQKKLTWLLSGRSASTPAVRRLSSTALVTPVACWSSSTEIYSCPSMVARSSEAAAVPPTPFRAQKGRRTLPSSTIYLLPRLLPSSMGRNSYPRDSISLTSCRLTSTSSSLAFFSSFRRRFTASMWARATAAPPTAAS